MLVEISYVYPRVEAYEAEANEEGQRLSLDIIDEVRDKAHARVVEIKRKHILFRKKASFYYSLRLKKRLCREEDLVLT